MANSSKQLKPANPDKAEQARLRVLAKSLGKACYAGELDIVRAITAMAPSLATDWGPIMNACYVGAAPVVAHLLKLGTDPNVLSKTGQRIRPLHRACEYKKTAPRHEGHTECVRLLLKAGADPLSRGTWMTCSAVAVAGCCGSEALVDLLVSAVEARDEHLSIYDAAAIGDLKLVSQHLKRNPNLAKSTDAGGMTALMFCGASRMWKLSSRHRENLLAIARLLLEHGADVNAEQVVGNHRHPVAMFAVANPAALKLVVDAGADPAKAVTSALWEKDWETLDALLSAGASVSRPPLSGEAGGFAHWGAWEASRWLIEHGADPNGTTKRGSTPLQAAAARGASPAFVRYVLEKGGDPHLPNSEGESALDIAKRLKRTNLIPLLKQPSHVRQLERFDTPDPARLREDAEFDEGLPEHMKPKPSSSARSRGQGSQLKRRKV